MGVDCSLKVVVSKVSDRHVTAWSKTMEEKDGKEGKIIGRLKKILVTKNLFRKTLFYRLFSKCISYAWRRVIS